MEVKHDDIGIVVSGGGMSCAYSAGALHALATNFGFHTPKIAIASSGGVPNTCCFIAGKTRECLTGWEDKIPNEDIVKIDFSEGRFDTATLYKLLRAGDFSTLGRLPQIIREARVDLELILRMLEEKTQLSTVDFTASPEVLMVATEHPTGKPTYFSTHDPKLDLYKTFLASMAIPILHGKPVQIDNKNYIDGDLSASIRQNTALAFQKGAKRVIAIDTTNTGNMANNAVLAGLIATNSTIARAVQGKISRYTTSLPQTTNGKVVCLAPSRRLQTGTSNNDAAAIAEASYRGFYDTVNNPQLDALFSGKL